MSQNVATSNYRPSASSLAFRAQLAQTISPLRRVTPRVPFWRLGAHSLPVLWTLYRGLLRASPAPDVRWRVQQQFRKHRHLTSPQATQRHLQFGHKLLDVLQRAKQGEPRAKAVTDRYASMVTARRDKDSFKTMLVKAFAERKRLLTRPILKGYLRPTFFNGPLPRLYPQPPHIAGMINRRKKAFERRQARYASVKELMNDIRAEASFEEGLQRELPREQKFEGEFVKPGFWLHYHGQHAKHLFRAFLLDIRRSRTTYPPALAAQIAAARAERVRNKRREFQRELRGEVLASTLRRARRAPPPHVLEKMGPRRRRWDAVARSSVSEVGYVGWVKRQLGFKLRDPDAWKVEIGRDEDQPRLDAMEDEIRRENERRRVEYERSLR
ncbi:hypothetical protein PHLGIDRAFT_128138 [Phlebiopsis gigantea 11061_1 CR5-6]|uniref:Complex 1 LYR protein domain-containing protein n=1 Tax=Phlebiopsis gigantea (strain 11061_1 CR5-6) TaxID=745531 RepID=A0A0C3S7D8_PHLG1|nr:hypothetical protein PHLGIDRAFT_128138 [Phlebiopsis gigantea 11061_1 CR5-6]